NIYSHLCKECSSAFILRAPDLSVGFSSFFNTSGGLFFILQEMSGVKIQYTQTKHQAIQWVDL
ncbi:hypothetical protein KKJ04_25435, partial [Xenorhabdus bovienii]|uniref:hypothetical protein n=1 Tax=Xenorhabdus bovienii TaxID=40576 RepID=UPI0023B24E31